MYLIISDATAPRLTAWILHYFTPPVLAFDAMLKCTSVQPEFLTNAEMLVFVERGIRGSVSQCSNRYAHAHNRCMPNFDPSKEESYLMYFDVSNLYGVAISQHLPIGFFESDHEPIDIIDVPDDAPEEYILEVDVEYPQALHETHNQAENTILSSGQVVTINIISDAPNYFLLHFLYILPSNFLKRCLAFYNKFKTVKNKCFRK